MSERTHLEESNGVRDATVAAAVGFAVRLAVVAWAVPRFPPAEDGRFYHALAVRLARGLGYTWAWPDGAVTYAAHYPVGYPALLAGVYRVFGEHPGAGMALNAALGALTVFAVHRVSATRASRRGALMAAYAVALHPGLVLYTPALMTEGVTGALLAIAAWFVVNARKDQGAQWRWIASLGVLLGVATLVRPQSLLVAPLFGALSVRPPGFAKSAAAAALATAIALAACAPWTLRNCRRMEACVLVSANAGWNLFIGAAPGATGSWVSLDELGVPPECKTVWAEAAKDACFRSAGIRAIEEQPLRWFALIPRKLASTFDYAGAAGWYLHSSSSSAFDEPDKLFLGVTETIWQRVIVLLALLAIAKVGSEGSGRPKWRWVRVGIASVSALALLTRAAWVAHVGLVVAAGLLGRRLTRFPALATCAAVVLSTIIAHGLFFGAGRYSLVCFPALAALAGSVLTPEGKPRDTRPL